jgi:hypothetical protein
MHVRGTFPTPFGDLEFALTGLGEQGAPRPPRFGRAGSGSPSRTIITHLSIHAYLTETPAGDEEYWKEDKEYLYLCRRNGKAVPPTYKAKIISMVMAAWNGFMGVPTNGWMVHRARLEQLQGESESAESKVTRLRQELADAEDEFDADQAAAQ